MAAEDGEIMAVGGVVEGGMVSRTGLCPEEKVWGTEIPGNALPGMFLCEGCLDLQKAKVRNPKDAVGKADLSQV